MEVLAVKNITKMYKEFAAVKNANMLIEEGDIYGFVGENGAGKTTIIRMITGLAKPTSGTYSLFGVDSTSSEIYEARKKTSGIIEAPSLSVGMTAYDNLKMQGILTGKELTKDEIIDLLTKVGLDADVVLFKRVAQFSLGMRQRLAIAVVLVNNPKFVILDEPMNGLDPQGFKEVRDLILKLNKEDGVTFLISSHILTELEKVATKIGFISHGEIIEEISMEELHKKGCKRIDITLINEEDSNKVIPLLMSKLRLQDVKANGKVVSVYDAADQKDILKALVKEDIFFSSANVVEETIEDYYLAMMNKGGDR